MPVLAVPYLVPFANAAGIVIGSVATAVGLSALSDKVQDYMEENPENSMKILAMIMPEQGIAALFNKEAGDEGEGEGEGEEVEEEVEVKDTRTKKEIVLDAVRKARRGKGNYSSPDAEGPAVSGRGSVRRGLEDAGKIPKDIHSTYNPKKPKFNWKRFTRKKADGGRIGLQEGGWSPGAGRDEKGYKSDHGSYSGGGDGGHDYSRLTVPIKTAAKNVAINKIAEKSGLAGMVGSIMNPLTKAMVIKGIYDKFKNPKIEDEDIILSGKKDGGRIGFEVGGLSSRAQGIYDSWIAAGHTEADVLAYLTAQGLYNAGGEEATGIETIVNADINQGGGGNGGGAGITNSYNVNQNLGPTNITDYEAEAYGIGPTFKGSLAKLQDTFSRIPTPFNLARMGINKFQDWQTDWQEKRAAKKEQELQAEIDAANQAALASIVEGNIAKYGNQDRPNTGINAPGGGKGQSPTGGDVAGTPFDRGGLATMFQRRR